jgi:hypothetical protein
MRGIGDKIPIRGLSLVLLAVYETVVRDDENHID